VPWKEAPRLVNGQAVRNHRLWEDVLDEGANIGKRAPALKQRRQLKSGKKSRDEDQRDPSPAEDKDGCGDASFCNFVLGHARAEHRELASCKAGLKLQLTHQGGVEETSRGAHVVPERLVTWCAREKPTKKKIQSIRKRLDKRKPRKGRFQNSAVQVGNQRNHHLSAFPTIRP